MAAPLIDFDFNPGTPFNAAQQAGMVGVQQGPGQIGFGNPTAQPDAATPPPTTPGWNPLPGTQAKIDAYHQQNKTNLDAYNGADAWMKNLYGTGFRSGDYTQGKNGNWQSVIKKLSGSDDPYEAVRKLYQTAWAAGKQQDVGNIRRNLGSAGLQNDIAGRLEELFGGSAESAARRLGIQDEVARRGGVSYTSQRFGYDPTKYQGTTGQGTGLQHVYTDLWGTNGVAGDTNGFGATPTAPTPQPAPIAPVSNPANVARRYATGSWNNGAAGLNRNRNRIYAP